MGPYPNLNEYNSKQIDIARSEASSVKKCFTDQTHLTIMACAAILGVTFRFLDEGDPFPIATLVSTYVVVILCLNTAHVGCHKYNTSNRTNAFQMHLSRIFEYSTWRKKPLIRVGKEMRQIDWEEAMFAWRVVQPVIFKFFYDENTDNGKFKDRFSCDLFLTNPLVILSSSIARVSFVPYAILVWISRWFIYFIKKLLKVEYLSSPRDTDPLKDIYGQFKELKNRKDLKFRVNSYPWYDTNKLLNSKNYKKYNFEFKNSLDLSEFWPGKYLKKMISRLHIVAFAGIAYAALILFTYKTENSIEISISSDTNIIIFDIGLISLIWFFWYFCKEFSNNAYRCRVLESGLLSIQSGAFVWRIVAIAHLLALKELRESKANEEQSSIPLYRGYTATLSRIAVDDFRPRLWKIHEWLNEKELELENYLINDKKVVI